MMLCTAPALRHRSAIDWSRQSQSDSRGYPAGGHRFAAAGPPCRADRRAAGERRRADGQICRRAAHPARRSAENFWPITAHFGFVQVPDLPAALRQAKASGCEIELRHAIFFNARDAVVAKRTYTLRPARGCCCSPSCCATRCVRLTCSGSRPTISSKWAGWWKSRAV
jgi:hypothetical protein